MDLREEQSIARAFKFNNDLAYTEFVSPWMRVPPDPLKNKYSSLFYFTVPKYFLERRQKVFLVVKDDLDARNPNGIPNRVVGETDVLDIELRKSLYTFDHPRVVLPVRYFRDDKSPLYLHLVMSKCRIEISCQPAEGTEDFIDRALFDPGYEEDPGRAKAGKGALGKISELDIFEDKDRW